MRCEQCFDTFCPLRLTAGECRRFSDGEKAEQAVIFTAPDTGFHHLGNGPWDKGYKPTDAMKAPEEGYWLRALSDEALMKELEIRQHPLLRAASDLVDAVERYVNPQMGQFCHRSELLIIKNKLKKLLTDEQD